jgi:hyperosmotically inducible protein
MPEEKQVREEVYMGKRLMIAFTVFLLGSCVLSAASKENSSFKAYVDSDICSHLYVGPLTQTHLQCSVDTHSQGSNAVLVRMKDNWVFQVNKEKMLKGLVGKTATATGELNYSDSTMKLQSVDAGEGATAGGGKDRQALDVRQSKTDAKLHERIRHELAMMPYVSYFDFISFRLEGSAVTLTGWTTRPTNRSEAYNRLKQIEGVESIVNNLEVTPLSTLDNQIRSAALATLQRSLPRYFWGNGSDIKIVVKNGDIILLGTVTTKADSDVATVRCNGIRNAFHVFNMLHVAQSAEKKPQEGDD